MYMIGVRWRDRKIKYNNNGSMKKSKKSCEKESARKGIR